MTPEVATLIQNFGLPWGLLFVLASIAWKIISWSAPRVEELKNTAITVMTSVKDCNEQNCKSLEKMTQLHASIESKLITACHAKCPFPESFKVPNS
jgi:predicted aldo/keto reductase-like oxidoreductase